MQNIADLGLLVRARRKSMDMSQTDLAALAGVSRLPVYQLEKGCASIKLETATKILDVLGLELRVCEKGNP